SASIRSIDCWMSITRARTSSPVAGGAAGRGPAAAGVETPGRPSGRGEVPRSAERNAPASGGADISRVARMVEGVAPDPDAVLFQSSSGLRTPREISTPANRPLEREYDRISAVMTASVLNPPRRPTGPAATEASAPRLTLFLSSFWTPDSF